jgi:prepilin-type N-terminal cleavage/methylation domain-containing protein
MHCKFCEDIDGFTLIELAIVLFIISLLAGSLLLPLATGVEQMKRTDTERTLEEIRETLYGFAIVNGRLACPDCKDNSGNCGSVTANDGLEDMLTSNNCTTEIGNVPKKPGAPTTFTLATNGDIDILDTDGGTPKVAQNIPAIVISHGKNHYADVQSADEVENYDREPTYFNSPDKILGSYSGDSARDFVYKDYILSGNDILFDDMMIWISPFVLKSRLVNAGRLP